MPARRATGRASTRIALAAVFLALAAAAPARGAWLDESAPAAWNKPGKAVPRAPGEQGNDDPRCREGERPAETSEDRAVSRAGWKLFRDYQAGWGVKVIWGLVTYDGMCRPMAYQAFAFLDGRFAGTLSPAPMASRTDGSLSSVSLTAAPGAPGTAALVGTFTRYAAGDPLCCPSRLTHVRYRFDGRDRALRLVPMALDTTPTSR